MGKSASKRPLGRNPVIAVRVPPPLHQEIADNAKAAERTMSAEMEHLLRAALDARKRFPNSTVAQAMEAATFAFLIAGETFARDIRKWKEPKDWPADPGARRAAALAGCQALLAFADADPVQQMWTVDVLKGRVALPIANPGLSAS
jgi:hypothetical protein